MEVSPDMTRCPLGAKLSWLRSAHIRHSAFCWLFPLYRNAVPSENPVTHTHIPFKPAQKSPLPSPTLTSLFQFSSSQLQSRSSCPLPPTADYSTPSNTLSDFSHGAYLLSVFSERMSPPGGRDLCLACSPMNPGSLQ